MTRSQRLQPLIRVKQQHQDDVARDVAERDRALAEQEQRLTALRNYAAEYSMPVANITNPALLANRLAFRERLDAAVVQQSRVVDDSRQMCDVERTRLLLASRETHVLEKLSASYRSDEARIADQKVQRELDDLGARRKRPTPGDEEAGA